MIRLEQGDILTADADALVNTVNCVGVMGRGIALEFKRAFPANFKAYAAACANGEVAPGRLFVHDTGGLSPRLIINFPTKRHWRGKSRIEDIDAGLQALVHEIQARDISSIAIPPLGAGLGGLDWGQVRPRIMAAMSQLPDVDVLILEPSARPDPLPAPTSAPAMTPGRAALVGLISRYLAGMMDTSVTLLEIHKLMYFLQRAHEPLQLRYSKAPYGPYAENLRHVLAAINGHLITGFAPGDAPTTEIQLLAGASAQAGRFLATAEGTHARFDRVAELVDGFESPYGLELIATVDWVMDQEHETTTDGITNAVYAWNKRKRQFTPAQLKIATDRLRATGFAPTA